MRCFEHRFGVTSVCEKLFLASVEYSMVLKVVHFQYGASIGILSAAMVICRRLNCILNIVLVSPTKADRRRVILVDLALGLTPPILLMAWSRQPVCLTVHPLLTCFCSVHLSGPSLRHL
jgi:hypothetical protein